MTTKGAMIMTTEKANAPQGPAEDEGTRSFSVFLGNIGEGALHAELGETLRDAVKQLEAHAVDFGKAKGEMTLKLKISIDREGGMVVISPEVATKLPKPARKAGVFWVNKSGNLVAENPRSRQLPLRAIDAPKPVAAPAAETAAPRGV